MGAVAVECDEEASRFAANCEALDVGDFMSPAEGGADVEGMQEAVRVEVVVARLVRSWTGARWVQMEWWTENDGRSRRWGWGGEERGGWLNVPDP
jgi:hypothetical protein